MSDPKEPVGAARSPLVVDASVVIKWHVTEVHSEAALRLLGDAGPALHVPDLVFPEVGNILWKKLRRGDLTLEKARAIARLVAGAPLDVHASTPLFEAAFEIAASTGRTVYDSLYVALAVQLETRLLTADEKLFNALKDGPLGPFIAWVEEELVPPAVLGVTEELILPDLGPAIHSTTEIELLHSNYTGDRLTDEDLSQVIGLPELLNLYLENNPNITDAGLLHLGALAKLETLNLSGTAVTDAGLNHLRSLTSLRMLDLSGTAVTDAGLSHLQAMVNLRTLRLARTAITDAGVAHLSGLKSLREIVLWETRISDAGLEHLRVCPIRWSGRL